MNLSNYSTFLVDANPNSDYFRITEFKETFTGGKNGFLIEGSQYLKETTEIKIEILDVAGNPIYFEPGNGIPEYYEGISKLIAVHVYGDTPIGIGKITVLGELKNYISTNGLVLPVPTEWQGTYNVKWEREFKINRNLSNEDVVRFYKRPTIAIDEIVKPIFSKTIPSVTQSGSLEGISQTPVAGTNLSNWGAGTLYRLKLNDGTNWTSSVDENIINVPSLGYSATVREVLNNKEVLVDTPYTINNIVSNFGTTNYTTSFEFVEGQTVGESALTGSFAKINIQQLKTFVGDVARVKVYRKSRNDIGDYQFVQESKLESTELLRDITTAGDTEVSYGNFTDSNLSTYWVTSSNDHPTTIDVETLNAAVKVNYNTGLDGVQQLITSESFNISKDVEYTISFKTLLSGSLDGQKTLKAYFSSSDYQQNFLTVSGSSNYGTRQNVSQNIIASKTTSAKLVLEFVGDDWYVSNVSLKNAQETSFSPDEFVLVQEIPRNVPIETFDFRFEFYDINNNYIPVTVNATKAFTGGNNFLSSTKFLSFSSDRTAFRFSTGSYANPPYQVVHLSTQRNGLTGSVLFASSAYDMDGNYIEPANYYASGVLEYGGAWSTKIQYPGGLSNVTDGGGLLHIHDFSGSLDYPDSVNTIRVGSIVYTASCETSNEYETIYRFEDGDNAPSLFVTSNANQFIYKATDLSLNPSGQNIMIEAKRKNLASTTTTLILNVESASNDYPAPQLVEITPADPATGVSVYTLYGADFQYKMGEVSYQFTGSDQFGNQFSDAVKITPVKILDGFSVSATNENTTFPATSTGTIIGGLVASSGSLSVKVGSETISYSAGFGENTYSASIIPTNATPNTFDGVNYSISALSADSGSLSILVKYKDGSGTIISSSKEITYSKAKKATPSVVVSATPQAQSVLANSLGVQTGTLTDVVVSALEGNTPQFTSMTATYGGFSTNPTISTDTLVMSSAVIDSATTEASASIIVTHSDSEGTGGQTKTIVVTATKVTQGSNGTSGIVVSVNPASQIITRTNTGTYGTPGDIAVSVVEGGVIYSYDNSSPYTLGSFYISNLVNGTNNNNKTITPDKPTTTAGLTTTFDVNYTTLTGVAVTIPQTHSISVTLDGQTGPGVVFTGLWQSGRAYQFSTGAGTGRRDVVLWSASGTAPYDTYYGAIRQHTSATGNVINGAPNQSAQTGWESLGTQDLFVAAKIGLFQESYVQNTLNIGTNNNGGVSTANITLAGGTQYPYFSLGQAVQGVYNANGIYIGSDAGVYKMSLKSGTNSLLWDGTNLSVIGSGTFSGTVNASGGNFTGYVTAGGARLGTGVQTNKNGIWINTDNYWYYDTTNSSVSFKIGDGTNNMVYSGGNLTLTGNLSAASGTITGGSILGGSINIGSGTFTVDSSGNLSATAGSFTGTINATGGTIGGFGITDSSIYGDYIDINSKNPHIILLDTSYKPRVKLSNESTFTAAGAGSPSTLTSLTTTYDVTKTASGFNSYYAGNSLFEGKTGASGSFNATGYGTNQSVLVTFDIAPNTYYTTTTIGGSGLGSINYSSTYDFVVTLVSPAGVVYQKSQRIYNNSLTTDTTFNSTSPNYSLSIPITMENSNGWVYKVDVSYGNINASNQNGGITSLSSTFRTPRVSNIVLTSVVEFTEINGAGIQVVGDTAKKVVIPRDSNLATAALQVTGFVTATGNIIAYYSDKRLKNILGNISNPLEKLEKLNGVYYTQSDKAVELGYAVNNKMQVGLIAQEVQEVLPEIIHLAPIDIDSEGNSKSGENYLSVDYDKVVPLLVESIKELKREIEELKKNR